jgi:hypothetical protein
MEAPRGLGWAFTVIFIAQIVPAGAWMVHRAIRTRSAVPILALAGGFAAGFGEAVLDALSNIWWPTNIPWGVFTAFGVRVPSYALMGYCLFLAVGSYAVYEVIRAGKGPRAVWLIAGIFFALDLLYEIPFLNLDLYDYYGPQPYNVAGFPLHWAFLNAMVVIVGGWMFLQMEDRMSGPGLFIAFCVPVVALGPLVGIAWPVFLTLHMDVAGVVRWIAATFAIGASVWFVSFVADAAKARQARPSGQVPVGSTTT